MPQKMIYVAEGDQALFERAQQIAGGNLSSAIVRALRLYVQAEENSAAGMRDVTVAVGADGERRQRFRGRLLARERDHTPDDTLTVRIVYQTGKGQFAVYTRSIPQWSTYASAGWESWDWSPHDYRLDVYAALDALRPHISDALFAHVTRKLSLDSVEIEALDI
jgi:EXLDI family protein